MFRSIRWRFIIVYFMLVFIGMVISGVFIVKSLELYNLNVASNRIDEISEILLPRLEQFPDLKTGKNDITLVLESFKKIGLREEVFVLDADYKIIATTSENHEADAIELLSFPLLVGGLGGSMIEDNAVLDSGERSLRIKDKVFPLKYKGSGETKGLLYVRYDLAESFKMLDQAKMIIIQATLLALVITVILGFLVAKGITVPINDVTKKAAKMASGDFDQYVEIKSDDEIGKLGEMFNYLTTELKVSMSEISREKSKMEAIINYMDDGLIAVDIEGKIIHLNAKASKLIDKAEIGQSFDDLFFKYNPNFNFRVVTGINETWTGTGQLFKDDSILKIRYAPFMNDKNEKSGIVFVIQDITEQERLDKMRKEFVANVSHELKTPLTSIKSYAETILDGGVDDVETQRVFLSVINVEADRMSRLVKDLLQLSNFDSQKAVMEYEFHDYVDLLKNVVKKVEVTVRSKGQNLKLVITQDEIIGYFDYDRMEQVVLNILSNAVKYTPDEGHITVYLSTDQDFVQIRVEDDGIGIPSEDIQRIFERFYRVDKARSRDLGGTGLGLSIAKEIVEVHDGTLKVSSEVDRGTVVSISLPLNPM